MVNREGCYLFIFFFHVPVADADDDDTFPEVLDCPVGPVCAVCLTVGRHGMSSSLPVLS